MEWKYKNETITVDELTGCFKHSLSIDKLFPSLEEAKKDISMRKANYYTITEKDIKSIKNKLNSREWDFVISLCKELDRHVNNPYCTLGITNNFLFDYSKTSLV